MCTVLMNTIKVNYYSLSTGSPWHCTWLHLHPPLDSSQNDEALRLSSPTQLCSFLPGSGPALTGKAPEKNYAKHWCDHLVKEIQTVKF